MSTFLDDVARSLAQPMPRRRAVRVLGGALASIAMSGVISRSARAAPSACDVPCPPNTTNCRVRRGAGCTDVCCGQDLPNLPKCCKWDVSHPFPNSSSYGCINKPEGNPPAAFPAHTICCCPANTRCGPIAGNQPCIPCAPGRKPCGHTCCEPDKRCVNDRLSLCCSKGEKRCGKVCCPLGSCARESTSLCCKPGKRCGTKCCHASQVCSGGTCRCASGWRSCGPELCCDKRIERCAPVGGLRTTAYCCPRYQWIAQTSTCCPRFTYPDGTGCCSLGLANKNCCAGVTCLAGTTCVNGSCSRLR